MLFNFNNSIKYSKHGLHSNNKQIIMIIWVQIHQGNLIKEIKIIIHQNNCPQSIVLQQIKKENLIINKILIK
jgi:hypothetical protein